MNMIDAVCNCLSAVTVLDQSLHCNQQILFLIIINVLHIICYVCPHQSDLSPLYDAVCVLPRVAVCGPRLGPGSGVSWAHFK